MESGGKHSRILHVCAGWQPWNGAANIARMIAAEQEKAGCRVTLRTWAGIGELRRADETWVHCAWMPCLWWAALWAKSLVWMPEGSYDPVRLAYHGWKKRLAAPVERWALRRADRVVATCEAEADWIRAYELKIGKIEISDIKRFFSLNNSSPDWGHSPHAGWGHSPKSWGQSPQEEEKSWGQSPKKEGLTPVHLLYLGREHPLKGLEYLKAAVDGIASGPSPECPVPPVEFRVVSSAFGEDKENIWKWCDILSLPTLSDNFGLVVAEALERGKTVITTDGAPAWLDCGDFGGRLVCVRGYRDGDGETRIRLLRDALHDCLARAGRRCG